MSLPFNNPVGFDVGSAHVKLSPEDRIAKSVLSGKPFEPDTLKLFGSIPMSGSRVIDIGCYSGLFSIAATMMGAWAIGFEPLPDNQAQIAKNQKLNKSYFALSTLALSDRRGHETFYFNPKVKLTSGASLEGVDSKMGRTATLKVETSTLDLFMKTTVDELQISVIKMDVEGHEPSVIRGARLTIDKHRPVLIIEANDEAAKAKSIQALEGLDYELDAVLDTRNLILRPRVPRG